MTLLWMLLASIPIAMSLWALLDAARRPAWAWSLAGRSQLVWIGLSAFGLFLVIPGMAIATWYLMRVRPAVAAVEHGDLRRIDE